MTDSPLVSFIIPNYQTDEYLSTAIESALEQSHDQIEILLVDSSGTETVRDLAEIDSRVEYLFQEPCGLSNARNYAISEANGDYIAFLDADDYWEPLKTEKQLDHLRSTNADVVYSDEYRIINSNEHYHSTLPVKDPHRHYIEFFRRGSGIPVRTVLGRKECFESYQFNEDLRAREDSNLWVRLFREYIPTRVPEPLAYKVVRDDAMTADVDMMYESELESIDNLVSSLPELKYWKDERKSMTHYKYGKQLLQDGRPTAAQTALQAAIECDIGHAKAHVLFFTALLPINNTLRNNFINLLERGHSIIE